MGDRENELAVRALGPEDAARYVAVRRAMLVDAPRAFASDPETDRGSDEAGVRASLAHPGYGLIGAFDGDELVGAAGLRRERSRKLMHRVWVWGVWVSPSSRGRGLGEAVMRRLIEEARSWGGVRVLSLSCNVEQMAALRLYERVGFVRWGVEPGMVCVDGRYDDEVHLQLRL